MFLLPLLVMDENDTMKCQWRILECYWRTAFGFVSEEKVPDCKFAWCVQLTPEMVVSYSSCEKLGPREVKKLDQPKLPVPESYISI